MDPWMVEDPWQGNNTRGKGKPQSQSSGTGNYGGKGGGGKGENGFYGTMRDYYDLGKPQGKGDKPGTPEEREKAAMKVRAELEKIAKEEWKQGEVKAEYLAEVQ